MFCVMQCGKPVHHPYDRHPPTQWMGDPSLPHLLTIAFALTIALPLRLPHSGVEQSGHSTHVLTSVNAHWAQSSMAAGGGGVKILSASPPSDTSPSGHTSLITLTMPMPTTDISLTGNSTQSTKIYVTILGPW